VSYPDTYFIEEEVSGSRSIFSPMLNFFQFLRARKIRKNIPNLDTKILDYGCGNGKLLAYLKSRGFNIDGYDPSISAVHLAQKRGLSVFFHIPDKKYDLMMFWHSLEHTAQPWLDIQNCQKYLVPNAKLIIAVPNADSLEARFFGSRWFCYDWPFHRAHFTYQSLKKLLESNGFKIISLDCFNPEHTVSSLVQTFLNLFFPKNSLYSIVSRRRMEQNKNRVIAISVLSIFTLIIFSPLLLIFFIAGLLTKRTAAFILVAEKNNFMLGQGIKY